MSPYSCTNKSFKYLLTVVHSYSTYAWCMPHLTGAMKLVLRGKGPPSNLLTNTGRECYIHKSHALMKEIRFEHYSTRGMKTINVERFNHTLISGKHSLHLCLPIMMKFRALPADSFKPGWTNKMFEVIKIHHYEPRMYCLEDMNSLSIRWRFYAQ
ncbi:hypothetical protein PR048_031865 [Dryococelus australis]|uniref:Uncharacterized protein n=1 Tax=Dryococelus australis TaxID=614101 RepID=A0ABQ9G6I6_9NEOP|nr:hypothetical protein PR048_031865 [Dryococelus australis]